MIGFVHPLALLASMVLGSGGAPTNDDYFPALDIPEQLGPADYAIQKRKYELETEVTLNLGLMPADPYYKGYTAGGGFIYHLSQAVAWEIVQVNYSFNRNTHLRDEVRRHLVAQGKRPPSFRKMRLFAASHLVFKPLYGKEALFNTQVLHLEAYLMGGPGTATLTPGRRFVVGGDVVFGLRLWVADALSVRLDLGEFLYLFENKPVLAMHLQIVLSANLGGDD